MYLSYFSNDYFHNTQHTDTGLFYKRKHDSAGKDADINQSMPIHPENYLLYRGGAK